MKIRNKIFINLILITVFSIAIVSGFVYYFGHQIIENNVGSYNYLLAQNAIDSVDRFIDRRLEHWQSYVVSNTDLFDALDESNNKFAKMENRNEYIKTQDDAWQSSPQETITPFIQDIISNPISDGLRLQTRYYEKLVGYKMYPEFFITNKYGVLVAATGKTSDYLQSDEDWWQNAMKDGVWVEDVSLDVSSGVYGLAFCIRIDNEQGKFLGVAKVIYNIKDVANIVNSAVDLSNSSTEIKNLDITRKTVYATLVNKDIKIIYFTKSGFGDLEKTPSVALTDYLTQLSSAPYLISADNGVKKLFSHGISKGSGNFKGLGWRLVIEKETQEALVSLDSLYFWLFFAILLSVSIAIILALFLSFSFVKPIKKLISEVGRVQKGELDVKITTSNHDEIGQLSVVFSEAMEAVKVSRAEVDLKVEEQTTEIRSKSKDLEDRQKAMLNILEDVEKEKKYSDNLAKDLEKFKLAVDDASDHIVITDREGIVLYANKAVERITGYAVKDAFGKKAAVLWKVPMPKEFYIKMWDTIKNKKQTFVGEVQNKRKNGEIYEAGISISPVLNEQGEVVFFVGVERDITKEKNIDRAKTEFVSLASHQLRTPLSTINWYAEMLLAGDAGKVNDEQKKFLEEIYHGNQRMVELVNALLNVSRIELGTFAIDPKPTKLAEIAKSVINEVRPQFNAKNLKVEENYDSNVPEMMLDDKLMRIIFQNFITNAIKYTPADGQIGLSVTKRPADVLIQVVDTGYGIPKNAQSKIFTKLFRADNVREKDTDGTGLGLYIVKAIVDQVGGKVWFESEENKGTTFFATIPVQGMKKKEGSKDLT